MNTSERFLRNTQMVTAYNDGISADQIAEEHGVTPATVYHVIREARLNGTTIVTHNRGRRPSTNADRDSAIVDAYRGGRTLESIGNDYGLSRERVRQIVKRSGLETYGRTVSAYRRWVENHGEEINASFTKSRSVAATVAAHPEFPVAWIRRILRPRSGESIHGRPPSVKVWSDDEIFAALAAAAVDGVVTTTLYTRWRRDGGLIEGRTPPTSTLITWRFGSWRNAVERAGLQIGRTSRTEYTRQWTRDDAINAVASFIADARTRGLRPTYALYDAWASENPGNPSGAYLRHLTNNSWTEIVMEAFSRTQAA
jgi:transposase